jgi:electron transfer flavoprotein beta subunit
VKQTVDFAVKVRVKADKTGVELKDVKMSMNPFDEIALEEAIRLKEKNQAQEVVAVTLGPKSHVEMCRKAMALGADRSIHIETPEQDAPLQPLAVAKVLQKVVAKEEAELVILGKQAIDDDSCQTGQILRYASEMDWRK